MHPYRPVGGQQDLCVPFFPLCRIRSRTFLGKQEGPRVLLLGGRAWQVNHIDWQRRIAYVEATDSKGRTRWKGQGQGLGFELSQAIRSILAKDTHSDHWSRRATERITEIREEFSWLQMNSSVAVQIGNGQTECLRGRLSPIE